MRIVHDGWNWKWMGAHDDVTIPSQALTAAELKQRCQEANLPTSGRKAVLVERLLQHRDAPPSIGSSDEDEEGVEGGANTLDKLTLDNLRSYKSAELRKWLRARCVWRM